jgi:peptidoglycan/LPS O-acetylase OafA/YrhL
MLGHILFLMPLDPGQYAHEGISMKINNYFYGVFSSIGWQGLILFFVISGFLITGILLDTRQKANYFSDFYLMRFLRLFPLYYCYLLLLFLIPGLLFPTDAGHMDHIYRNSGWVLAHLTNFLVAREGWEEIIPVGHLWSLALQEQFYLFWPLLVLVCSRRTLLVICTVIVVFCLLLRCKLLVDGVDPTVIYVLPFTRLDSLAIGSLLAVLIRSGLNQVILVKTARMITVTGIVVFTAIFLLYKRMHWSDPVIQSGGFTLFSLCCASVIVLALNQSARGALNRLLSNAGLRFLGRHSYGLYVWHPAIISIFISLGLHKLMPRWGSSELPSQLAFYAITFSASVLVSIVSWHLIEKRFLKFRRLAARKEESKMATVKAF